MSIPAIDHRLHHLVADVHQRVGRRHREVTFLVANFVAQVRTLDAAPVPFPFNAIEVVVAFVRSVVEPHIVEDEKFGFRANEAGIRNAGALQIVHRFAGHVARIARVIFARDRVLNIAHHHQRRDGGKRIEECSLGLRHDEHVALVNGLPAADARAVKTEPVFEHFLVELVDGDGKMLPQPRKIHKPQIDRLNILFAAQCQHFFRLHSKTPLYEGPEGRN